MSYDKDDFTGPMTKTSNTVQGIGGTRVQAAYTGTIKWQWQDDMGVNTTHLIPNSVYVPDSRDKLLSPQHWAQERAKSVGDHSTGCYMDTRQTKLTWGNKDKHTKTVNLCHRTNVPMMYTSPGYSFKGLSALISDDEEDEAGRGEDFHLKGRISVLVPSDHELFRPGIVGKRARQERAAPEQAVGDGGEVSRTALVRAVRIEDLPADGADIRSRGHECLEVRETARLQHGVIVEKHHEVARSVPQADVIGGYVAEIGCLR